MVIDYGSDFFRGQTVAGGKWRKRHNAMDYPNTDVIIVVVLQVFREGIVTTMDHSTTLAATRFWWSSTEEYDPTNAWYRSCITMAVYTETATIRLSVFSALPQGLILSLWPFDFEKKYRKALFFIKQSCIPLFFIW
jgi:hypothetical protein